MPPQFAPGSEDIRVHQEAHVLATAMERAAYGQSGAEAEQVLNQVRQDAFYRHQGSPAAAQAEIRKVVAEANHEVQAQGFPGIHVSEARDANSYPRLYIDRNSNGFQERWDGRNGCWDRWDQQYNRWQPTGMYSQWGQPPFMSNPGDYQYGPMAPMGPQAYNPQYWCQEARNVAHLEMSAARGNPSAMMYLNQELQRDAAAMGPQAFSQFMSNVNAIYQREQYEARYAMAGIPAVPGMPAIPGQFAYEYGQPAGFQLAGYAGMPFAPSYLAPVMARPYFIPRHCFGGGYGAGFGGYGYPGSMTVAFGNRHHGSGWSIAASFPIG